MIRTIAEIGINHNGDLATAVKLQEAAAHAGCWAVKYQIRTNFHACVPKSLWNTKRKWQGRELAYFDYRAALEFSDKQLSELYDHAQSLGLEWFASCWDVESVSRLAAISREYIKIASAHVTHLPMLQSIVANGFQYVFISTGMSYAEDVVKAYRALWNDGHRRIVVMACTSVYPCPTNILNLDRIRWLHNEFNYNCEVGYSGHENGILPSLYAAVLGATYIERHITLDKNQEGSDHKASLEPHELKELCDRLAEVPVILGSPDIQPLPEEQPSIEKLRVA